MEKQYPEWRRLPRASPHRVERWSLKAAGISPTSRMNRTLIGRELRTQVLLQIERPSAAAIEVVIAAATAVVVAEGRAAAVVDAVAAADVLVAAVAVDATAAEAMAAADTKP